MKVLTGNYSQETAHVVDDYPYGFRLRCKMRYWLEYKPGKGVRFWSQTTNPKRPGEVWNKAKASTYHRFGAAMYLDEQEHVHVCGISEFDDYEKSRSFKETFGAGVPPEALPELDHWIEAKRRYEDKLRAGQTWQTAGNEVALESVLNKF